MVVGAGPCGTALALLLARAGIAVALVEARSPHQFLPRGEGLMPSGSEALERLGLGKSRAEVARQPLRSWDFWLERRPLFSVAEPMGDGPPCSLIRTPALLELLLAQARACPTLRWHPGRRVSGLVWEEEGHLGACEVVTRGDFRDGEAAAAGIDPADEAGAATTEAAPTARVCGVALDDGTTLGADLVVACDGRESRLLALADLQRQEDCQPVSVLWFALEGEATAAAVRWLDGRFVTLVAEGESLALYAPAGGGLRLGWLLDGEEPAGEALPWPERWARLSPPDLAALWRQLPAAAVPEPVRVTIRPALAERWQRPGLLLLGDAAHPMSPLRAQGLNMALRDAVVAGERLQAVLGAASWQRWSPAERRAQLDQSLVAVERQRRPEIIRIQALQREELERALLLRRVHGLRRLLAATARWSGPLLARRWQAGQPTLRRGLPLG